MPIIEEETEVSTRIDNIYEHKVILFNDDFIQHILLILEVQFLDSRTCM